VQGLVHIVDDNASFRTATERRLKKAGYAVATYASAQPLLDRLLERLNERLGGEGLCKKCDASRGQRNLANGRVLVCSNVDNRQGKAVVCITSTSSMLPAFDDGRLSRCAAAGDSADAPSPRPCLRRRVQGSGTG
jgi:CheY-like chemotaxis protein